MYAHIPQDFDMDIETNGDINGVNPGDSKLLSLNLRLVSTDGVVQARRVKADDAFF